MRQQFPKEVTVVGFVDDIDVTIVAQGIKENEILINETIWNVRSWLVGADLALAE